jgi:hypothetical protein
MNPEPAAHGGLDPALSTPKRVRPRSVQTRRDDVARVRLRVGRNEKHSEGPPMTF